MERLMIAPLRCARKLIRSLGTHAAISALALCAFTAVPARAGPYTELFLFGDSVSDTGNVAVATAERSSLPTDNAYIPGLPYSFGTFSNGPVWATYFAEALGLLAQPSLLGGTNYAFGGARVAGLDDRVPTLTAQVGMFFADTQGIAPSDALYIVAPVGNDARDTLAAIGGGTDAAMAIASGAASYSSAVGAIVDQLQAAGAQQILVMNTANIGLTPAVLAIDHVFPGAAALATTVALAFDMALTARMAAEVGVDIFDTFAFITSSARGGLFANVTDACGAVQADCSQYLFWDGIHPTTAGHAALAEAVYAQVVSVDEPQSLALLAFALVVLAMTRPTTRKT